MNPWKDSSKHFDGIENLIQMSSAVNVFDKLVIDEHIMPVNSIKSKVDDYIIHLDEISRLEEQIDTVLFNAEELKFHFEYKDLLHSTEIGKKTSLLNEICDKIGVILKNKPILVDLLQQKGGSSDALPLHRNFHKQFHDFLKITATLINTLPQNLAIIEQASTMDQNEFRKEARRLVDLSSSMQKFNVELEHILDL